jgi:hypothetical protein
MSPYIVRELLQLAQGSLRLGDRIRGCRTQIRTSGQYNRFASLRRLRMEGDHDENQCTEQSAGG